MNKPKLMKEIAQNPGLKAYLIKTGVIKVAKTKVKSIK